MSMAAAYKMKKRAKTSGGDCADCRSGNCMAHGGEAEDIVDRAMKKRSRDDAPPIADSEKADYDVLADHEEDGEADETAANSGDELGNKQKDEDERDVVARAMKSRAKKDRMPRPA